MVSTFLISLLFSVVFGNPFIQIPQQASEPKYRLVCYHTNWSQYRPGIGHFQPEDIDPSLCTHLIYSFAKCEDNKLKSFEWNDESTDWSKGNFEKFNDLKLKNPNLKTLLAVGGWNHASTGFTTMVASKSSRSTFISQTIQYLRKWKFDGLDLDWEYPAARGGVPEDKERFTALVREFISAFHMEVKGTNKERLLLTAAVAAGENNIVNGYEIGLLSVYFDFINVMTYDLHGSWDPVTGMHSALHKHPSEKGGPDAKLNQASAIKMWLDGGAPASKLNLGIPTYGRSFTLTNPSENGIGAPSTGPGDAGQFTREKGFLAYYEVCQKIHAGGTKVWNPIRKVPYAYWGNQWVGYDDSTSIALKVDWMKDKGIGGALVWALDLDDFNGNCPSGEKWPLIKTIKSQMETNTRAINPPGNEDGVSATTQTMETTEFSCHGKPNAFYPNPTDCFSYIVCISDVRHDVTCLNGNHWNSAYNRCDPPEVANCAVMPVTTTLPPTTTDRVTDPSACKEIHSGVASHPSDCSQYLFCYQEEVIATRYCQSGTLFDPTRGFCNVASQVTCENQETTEASTTSKSPTRCRDTMSGAESHDTDCSKYYICYQYAIVATQNCPDGTLFDTRWKFCNQASKVTCGGVFKTTEASTESVQSVCEGVMTGGRVAHPSDCSKYLVCSDGAIASTHVCPPDMLFSPDLLYCNWPSLVTCQESRTIRTSLPPTTATPSQEATETQHVILEDFCLSQPNGYYSHPNDCNGYIRCVGSRTYIKQCPNNLHWNQNAMACDWPQNAICSSQFAAQVSQQNGADISPTEFTCSGRADGHYPDANNNKKWFWCVHGQLHHMECPSQLIWDSELQVCNWP
ncbi:acidic mammalian chitinase-like [Anneissia japonica]|uniref:acidic mammalian chitinase-like n=1 Tax=Anneissia japonica TaxID=1529436 RepID=UPI0014257C84|nr:acidic mammalian chitinase-like [Anneissia japonica]